MERERRSDTGADHLRRVRRICAAMPECTEKLSHGAPTFFGPKVFAMFVDNHHNDGHVAIWIPVKPGMQPLLIEDAPETFFRPPYVGVKGWVGVELAQIADEGLAALIRDAWTLAAPKKKLAAPKKKLAATKTRNAAGEGGRRRLRAERGEPDTFLLRPARPGATPELIRVLVVLHGPGDVAFGILEKEQLADAGQRTDRHDDRAAVGLHRRRGFGDIVNRDGALETAHRHTFHDLATLL